MEKKVFGIYEENMELNISEGEYVGINFFSSESYHYHERKFVTLPYQYLR